MRAAIGKHLHKAIALYETERLDLRVDSSRNTQVIREEKSRKTDRQRIQVGQFEPVFTENGVGQPFVKDPDLTIGKLLKNADATVTNFVRFEVGEGIEKKEENFADEVMQQIKDSKKDSK